MSRKKVIYPIKKIESFASKGFADSEIANILDLNKTKVEQLTKKYWIKKMRVHNQERLQDVKSFTQPETKIIAIHVSENKAIVVKKCLRCTTIRDKSQYSCNICK